MRTEEQEKDARAAMRANQKLIHDQREANAQMESATIRAQEPTEQAQPAQVGVETTTNELRESEERFRTLFDLIPTAAYSCDASGVILQYNRYAAELWGREPAPGDTDERFCGSHKLFRTDGTFMPHDQCPMAEVLSGKLSEARDAEVLIERPDGSRITVIVNIRPLKNRRGEVTAAINCFYDITDRKQAERELAASLKRERELAEFRELFIGMLGHDLRNPLGFIVMAAGLLLQGGRLDNQDAKRITHILSASQRMARMISQMLDFTRARLGDGLPIERRPTDLREVCQSVVEEFEPGAIRLEVEGDVTGNWDPDRLAQVFSNLLGNAVEHATHGTAVVVRAHSDGEEVVVDVTNRGNPIPADVMPFIFEPFRRARQREKSSTGNIGLGLYIAHHIVQSKGGTLDAHSADGTTTFTVRLPRRPLARNPRLSPR
jgi:PAS domain S-box-containing protein